LPLCSIKHHHTLKRRLTPAETKWPAYLAAPLLRAVFFIGREDCLSARRGPGVVCCMSDASGNRRTAPMSSDTRMEYPTRGCVKLGTSNVIAWKCAHLRARASRMYATLAELYKKATCIISFFEDD
jgi:hypothetical protein